MSGQLQVLTRDECLALLPTVPVGRLVYTHHALPAVVPVNFVVDGNEILVRTGYGSSLAAAVRQSVVAFQVDDIDRELETGWSITVTGPAREETDDRELARLSALPLRPWAAGVRDHFLKIGVELVHGRRRPAAVAV
jgi:nitroimidazol reductase NimA-like FMN-containing flavoprotein (pyridoxamine 5'-phosphate oxidase superfamily)